MRQENSGLIPSGLPGGREPQTYRSTTHQLFNCCSGRERRVPWEEKWYKKKCRDIYWKLGQTDKRLSMGQWWHGWGTCYVRHRGGPVRRHARMDEVIEKQVSDKFFGNTVFGRESWSCKKAQWDTDMGRCASLERGLCWRQAQASGWNGRKICRIVNSDWSVRVIRWKNPKYLGILYCFTSWTQRLTILDATNLVWSGIS